MFFYEMCRETIEDQKKKEKVFYINNHTFFSLISLEIRYAYSIAVVDPISLSSTPLLALLFIDPWHVPIDHFENQRPLRLLYKLTNTQKKRLI